LEKGENSKSGCQAVLRSNQCSSHCGHGQSGGLIMPFDHENTQFSLEKAYGFALASQLAYQSDKDIIKSKVLNEWKFGDFDFFDRNGTQGFVASNDNIIMVVFRGTDALEDWITDLDFVLVNGPLEGKVHRGFDTALDEVWGRIQKVIPKFKAGKEKSLWFTGHSLGAALATLSVARLRDDDRPVDGLYTFGQPRVGDRTFARNFNIDFKPYSFRFVNNNDSVTRIPQRLQGYSHVGTLKYFTKDGELKDDISWWNRFLDRVYGRFEDFFVWGTDGIKDHKMEKYIDSIQTTTSLKATLDWS